MMFGSKGNRSLLPIYRDTFSNESLCEAIPELPIRRGEATRVISRSGSSRGEYRLLEIRAVEVESWLKSLNRAPGTRCKIRNVMRLLFNHGCRHDLCDRNPIKWVRQG